MCRYELIHSNKATLKTLDTVNIVFLLLTAGIAYMTWSTLGHTHVSLFLFSALLLPLVRHKAAARNNRLLMLLYSLGCAAAGGYTTYAGIGKTLTVVNENGWTPYVAGVLAINVVGVASLYASMYTARQLVNLFEDPGKNKGKSKSK